MEFYIRFNNAKSVVKTTALDLACDVHYLTGVKEAKYSIFTVAVKVLKSADDV